MAKFIIGNDGFDGHPTGVLQSSYPWVNSDLTNGPTIATGGVFGGNCLSFSNNTLANAVKLTYMIDTSIVMQRANTAASGTGMFSVSFWFQPGSGTTPAVPILAIGNASGSYNLMGYSNAGNGVLVFPSNLNNIADNPVTFNMTSNTPVWVTVAFAFWATGRVVATYAINTYKRKTNYQLSWSSDALNATVMDRVLFYQGSYDYALDDVIIQAVSSADAGWPVATGVAPNPGDIGILNPRQIRSRTVSGNGATNTWEPSTAPNYTAATTAGQYILTDSDANGVDLYTLASQTGITGIDAVTMRGKAALTTGLVQVIQSPNATVGGIANVLTHRGSNGFSAISETDGTNPWTAASINAAQFGLKG